MTYRVNTLYRNGVKMTISGGHEDINMGVKWFGEEGWVYVRRGQIDAHPKSLLHKIFGPTISTFTIQIIINAILSTV
jgi:uncharacterized protein YodC (DUF2158 family)